MENLSFNAAYGFEIQLSSTGKTYFPDIEILRHKKIAHLVVCQPDTTFSGSTATTANAVTLVDPSGVQFIHRDSFSNYESSLTFGRLQPINRELILPSCFVEYSIDGTGQCIYVVALYNDNAPKYKETAKTNIELTEVVFDGSKRIMLNEELTLVGRNFRNILFDENNSLTPSGNTSVSAALIASVYLTLVKGSREIFHRVPLVLFIQLNNHTLLKMNNVSFDFPNSFIEVLGDQSADISKAIFLNFEIEA